MHPMNSPRVMIGQFDDSIKRGEKWILPSSRILGIALVSLTLITSQDSDPEVAAKWKYYAAAMLVVMQVAWYEVVFIFPINGAIRAMGREYDKKSLSSFSDPEKKRLLQLLYKWSQHHTSRIIAPLAGACILVAALA